jgi:hypothetical protein
MRIATLLVAVVLSIGLTPAESVLAQAIDGRIAGRVEDAAGHPVAGTPVMLRRPGLDGLLTVRTDADGRFFFTGLGEGAFEVRVTFGTRTIAVPVTLAAGAPAATDVLLVGPRAAPTGREVRVVDSSGVRRAGRLVSLDDREVVLRLGGQDVAFPLATVRRIERVPHHLRNFALLGAAAGFFGGLALCEANRDFCTGDEGYYPMEGAMLFAGVGAGIGAVTGLVMNLTADRTIHLAPGPARIGVAPVATPRRTGVTVVVRW